MKYNLEVLNDKEFEDLCKDLLDAEFNIDLQIFKSGKDGGIDLLYSNVSENEIVVQIKHYISSSYSMLKRKLKDDELISVKNMEPKPKKYILATSMPLSPKQCVEVKNIMAPYIRSTNDIYGRSRIEALISKHPEVEEKNFKLWLTSTNVLKRIINHASNINSEFYKEEIISKAKLYVPNQNFNMAIDKLNEHKFLIISGVPGVGKTTLAFMLIYERLSLGYDLVFCDGKISEIEGMLSNDPKKKQIFFIDDFLGANLYDIRNPKNAESKIVSFIQKIKHYKNKLLILTSRTTILNQANHQFESLKRSNLTEISKYELKLSEYSLYDKAKILYNHLYFKNLGEKFSAPFYKKDIYTKIVEHPSYFPRTIQFITDESNYSPSEYPTVEDFIFNKLNKPEQIWAYAFEQQLDSEDRFLVMTLFSLGGDGIKNDILEEAFESRYSYEIEHNNVERKPRAFRNSLKKLLDGFIKASQDPSSGINNYSFLNPSIVDFLLDYLKNENDEKMRVLNSISFIEQISTYFGFEKSGKIVISDKDNPKYFTRFLILTENLKSIKRKVSVPLEILDVLMTMFRKEVYKNQAVIIRWVNELLNDPSFVISWKFSHIIIAFHLEQMKDVTNLINTKWNNLIEIIVMYANCSDDLRDLTKLFEIYDQDFSIYIQEEDNKYNIENKMTLIFEELGRNMDYDISNIGEMVDYGGDDYAEERVNQKIWDEYVEFVDDINLNDYFDYFDHSYDVSASQIVSDALDHIRDSFKDSDRGHNISNQEKVSDPWQEIDRLFRKPDDI